MKYQMIKNEDGSHTVKSNQPTRLEASNGMNTRRSQLLTAITVIAAGLTSFELEHFTITEIEEHNRQILKITYNNSFNNSFNFSDDILLIMTIAETLNFHNSIEGANLFIRS